MEIRGMEKWQPENNETNRNGINLWQNNSNDNNDGNNTQYNSINKYTYIYMCAYILILYTYEHTYI